MDKKIGALCESIVPLPGAVALPPLPWDLDTTNARLTIPIKVGELVDALHRWGREVYAAGQAAPGAQAASNGTKHTLSRDHGGEGMCGWTCPMCSCGWVGTKEYAYGDHQHTNLREQEKGHIADAVRAGGQEGGAS